MPYLFTCPHCQTQTRVDDDYSGQAGRCVTCGGEIQIPDFASQGDQGTWLGRLSKSGPRRSRSMGWIAATIVSVVILGCLVFAVIRIGGRTMSQLTIQRDQTTSIRNLERIAQALNAYAADHGTYPPPVTFDTNRRALHSWRVLILPYLGEDDLYNEFDVTLPWDHPTNMQAAMTIPTVYQHPRGNQNNLTYQSAYYLITGSGTLFPPSGPLSLDQITDDPAKTILVIEAMPLVSSGLWTQPIDLDFSRMQGSPGMNLGIEPGGLFPDGVALSTVDGRGHFISNTVDPVLFRSMVTPQGGERLPDDLLD